MASKLKQRRLRRLKADVTWWRAEAQDWKEIALEHAAEIDYLRQQVIRVPMPVIVPAEISKLLDRTSSDNKICVRCNDGIRGGCSSCANNVK